MPTIDRRLNELERIGRPRCARDMTDDELLRVLAPWFGDKVPSDDDLQRCLDDCEKEPNDGND